jgi:hypothetical protein
MILVWGVLTDFPTSAVLAALSRLGEETFLLDQGDAHDIAFHPAADGQAGGVIRTGAGVLDLADVTAAYVRPHETARLLAGSCLSATDLSRIAACDDALLSWCDFAPARIVNRPEAMASNNSKPYQTTLIHDLGFAVPATLVTNDIDALAAFQARHGKLVYKSASGIRSIVALYDPRDNARQADLATCPTQFQQWIPGTDVRVHVVGNDVFACEVRSPAIDYRYPRDEAERPSLTPCSLPSDIAAGCRKLAAGLGLDLAGIDLRRSENDGWVCFEVNPSPGFTYYEDAAGLPIAAATARLLAGR